MAIKSPTSYPPSKLQLAKKRIAKFEGVSRAGLTITAEGEWALKVWMRHDLSTSIEDTKARIEDKVRKIDPSSPIIFVQDYEYTPIARPAYPALGE